MSGGPTVFIWPENFFDRSWLELKWKYLISINHILKPFCSISIAKKRKKKWKRHHKGTKKKVSETDSFELNMLIWCLLDIQNVFSLLRKKLIEIPQWKKNSKSKIEKTRSRTSQNQYTCELDHEILWEYIKHYEVFLVIFSNFFEFFEFFEIRKSGT